MNNSQKIYDMKLNDEPFRSIKSGAKTVEMRLNDERRKGISVGDRIVFSHRESGDTLLVDVIGVRAYDSFDSLYRDYDKLQLGYAQDEAASPSDMLAYYTEEQIARYGVLAIEVKLV